MSAARVFRFVVDALDCAGIPYMLTGSFTSNLYGTARATQDIDLVISAKPEQMQVLQKLFPIADYYFDLQGWKVDLIFLKSDAYHQEAFRRRVPAELEGVPIVSSTAEDLILAKLDWARMGESMRQIQDVAGVLKVQKNNLDFEYIEKWVNELGLDAEWSRARELAGLS
jgi:predicted nucleotidyltransferase